MNPTGRDKVLILLLPSLLVVGAYGWMFFMPLQKQVTSTRTALQAARDKDPEARTQLAEAQAKLTLEKYQLRRLEVEKAEYRKAWERVAGSCASAKQRNERIEKLNNLLAARRLRLVDDSEAESSSNDCKICPALEKLGEHFTALSAEGKPQLRRIHVVGRYLDVLAALEDMAKGEVIAIPVGLRLKEAPVRYRSREWVLLVWI